nr:immunoglobulin light chain junction region [Macaca mulatta]
DYYCAIRHSSAVLF